jgi:tetratricopeptide (TPR) repeat protein
MDCRKPVALALSLLAGSAGCSHTSSSVPAARPPAATPVAAAPKAENFDPEVMKRAPKPETFVAYGDYSAREASSAQTPAEQEQLRERARKAYQEALKLDANNVPALRSLARLYASSGDYARAKETSEAALNLSPNDAALWFDLGMTYGRTKDWAAAIEHMAHAIELDPENRSYHRYMGFMLARAGRTQESLAEFTRYEGEAKGHYLLAEMLEHVGQVDACKMHLQLALAKDPRLSEATNMLVRLSGVAPKPGVARAAAPTAAPTPALVAAGGSGIQTVGYTEPARPAAAEQAAPSQPAPNQPAPRQAAPALAAPRMLPAPPPMNPWTDLQPGASK